MNAFQILIQVLIFLLGYQNTSADKLVACHYKNVNFNVFCNELSAKTGVRIFYDETGTKDFIVNLDADSISVINALGEALKGSDYMVSHWHNNLVILKGKQLIQNLPSFDNDISKNNGSDVQLLTETEARYIQGRRTGDKEVIIVGNSTMGRINTKVRILGKITEQETGEPVIGATMFVEELSKGTITDENGFLTMALKPGKYNVRFEFMGLEKKQCLLDVYTTGEFSIELKKVIIPIDEVVVYGDRQINIISRDPGMEKISAKTVKEIPTMMGERDILKVSEMLPGIVSVGEGSAGLNVRGGSADQNAFYINNIPVYNTSHLFGFFPAFNSDIVKDFSIYKGYVPVQFGGRISSVFNILTRQGNRKHFTIHGGINPVTANLTFEGPLKKDKSSFLLSGRSSYSNWILKRIKDPLIRNSTAQFNDIALSMNYDLKNSQISIFGFNSYDYFRLSDINDYQYSNSGAALSFKHNFNTDVRGELSLVSSRYTFNTIDKLEMSSAYKHGYAIDHYELKLDFNQISLSKHNLDYGTSVLLNKLDRGTILPFGTGSLRSKVNLGKEKGLEASLYLSDMIDLFPWLKLTLGARYAVYAPLGPKQFYTYEEGAPYNIKYINDSVSFGRNQAIRWYSSPELRATINLTTDENGSVKLAFNQMHQNMFMLSNTITIAPNTQWKLADYYLKPARSNQLSLGVFRNFPQGGWETSAELYYKSTRNFPEFRDGANFLDDSPIETLVLQGKQKAYGVELFVKRNDRKLNGWINYTWSRSLTKIDGGTEWSRINGGASYPSNYDIPHAINALINYQLSRRFGVSSVITYQTGRPVTYPTSIYYINDFPYVDYSKRNQYHIPDYFRMDLSVTLEGNLRRNKPVHSSLMLNVYNLTGRRNAYSVYFKSEHGEIKGYKYAVIGVPLFTITYVFKLGNYASE